VKIVGDASILQLVDAASHPFVQVRKLHNDRRDAGWSFTMLYLVKDSFALMLEGAGLW
jgi:hypothetical protein